MSENRKKYGRTLDALATKVGPQSVSVDSLDLHALLDDEDWLRGERAANARLTALLERAREALREAAYPLGAGGHYAPSRSVIAVLADIEKELKGAGEPRTPSAATAAGEQSPIRSTGDGQRGSQNAATPAPSDAELMRRKDDDAKNC